VTRDIKATVDELERLKSAYQSTDLFPSFVAFNDALLAACEGMLDELRRVWAIEEAAVSLREASEAYQELKLSADMAAVNYAHRRNAEAREDLFAALPPRKEGT